MKEPADQPKLPGDGSTCESLASHTPPTLAPPEPCPKPHPCCKCPPTTSTAANCLQTLIDKQAADIIAADKAKAFKADLEKILDNANKASQGYTSDRYGALLSEWLRQDVAIAELIRKLECAVPCWRCILDCYVCPLLHDLHNAEKYLHGGSQFYTEMPEKMHNIYDMQYWHQRNKAAKQRTTDRIASVISAWSDPAKTIESTLSANRGLIESVGKVIGTEPGKAIFDGIVILVQRHLLIAPPASPETMTKIDKEYTKFCEFDQGKPDDCCGPDVGELSLRQRLSGGPLPYLIRPGDYFTLICCLVEKRYVPAKNDLSKAEADLAAVTDQITRYEAQLKNGWAKTLEAAAKAAIPGVIDCCDYQQHEENTHQQSHSHEKRW